MSSVFAARLVLDQGVPRDAATLLRDRGYDCTHVGEVGMSRSSDEEILRWTLEQSATVITLDADFHAILAVSGAAAPSVIRLRIQGLVALPVAELVEKALKDHADDLAHGCMVTIKANKTTCHRLPIGNTRL